jgi:hypothetical protein
MGVTTYSITLLWDLTYLLREYFLNNILISIFIHNMLKVILHQFWVKKIFPENSIWNTAVPLLSYSCMFQVEISSQQLEICKSVYMFIVLVIIVETD